MAFQLNKDECLGCGACAYTCLYHAISPADENMTLYAIDENVCVECGQCSHVCPNSAISAPDGWKKIKKVTIEKELCKGCSLCRRVCAADAPFGEIKQPFEIDQSKCFQCGHCASKCRFGAIVVEYE